MANKSQGVRKTPMRKCTGCNEMKNKKDLVRVVKNKEGEICLDLTGKKAGRGAYICADVNCLKTARKNRGLERAFSCRIPNEIYDQMQQQLEEKNEEIVYEG